MEVPLTAVPSTGASPAATADASTKPGRFAAVHPMLFAAYAVLFLWSQNLGETDPAQVLVPLVVLVAGAAVLTIVLGVVFRDRRRGALVASAVIIPLLMYGHAAHFANAVHIPVLAQQVGWVLVVIGAVVVAWRLDIRRIDWLDTALDRIAGLLVIVALVLIVPYQVQATSARASLPRPDVAGTTTTAQKRDVYWLIFDRYGSDRSLKDRYRLDNDLTPWLDSKGFTVLPDSHANYIRTVLSIAATSRMAHLTDIEAAQGKDSSDVTTVDQQLQDPLVARQFKALGYRYYHVGNQSDPTRTDSAADVNLNVSTTNADFAEALYDVSALQAVARRLHIPDNGGRERQFKYSTYNLDTVESLKDEPGPKYVFGHVLLPHPPAVFAEDGSFLTDDRMAELGPLGAYKQQLAYTNRRIRELVEGLLALPPDKQPIIILQADEGPYPGSYEQLRRSSTDWAAGATGEELETKYGILDAWYVPGGTDGIGLYPTMTAINTFPVLFKDYFGLPYDKLPDTVYSSHDWSRPYDLTDITDRLPSLE